MKAATLGIHCAGLFLLALAAACTGDVASLRPESPPPAGELAAKADRWSFFLTESRVDALVHRLSREVHRPAITAFVGVSLVAMRDDAVLADRSVVVEGGRIAAVGKTGEVAIPAGAQIIDGAGRFLMPGVTDMHVHNLVSSSQHLLHIATGVTSVRDMDGFPWMLQVRKRIEQGALLAPTLYITGHILNARPMEWYATVVTSPEQARAIVREQQAMGYDFIKLHNMMPPDIYRAILDEASRLRIDVVGHIPHDILVRDAVSLGQRTFEHFKGYILDANLTLTSEDYVAATRGAEVWNCPTFYTYRSHLRGDAARKLVQESEEMQYVSARDRKAWLERAAEPPEPLQQNIFSLSRKIFHDLLPIGAQFIAGTDSGGGYDYMVPGFALHEELRILQEEGLSPYETLKTATVNAARAMRRSDQFGTIEPGKRADLLLLSQNPLADVKNVRALEGVMVRGIWLSKNDIDRMLGELSAIYRSDEVSAAGPSPRAVDEIVATLQGLRAEGYVLRDHDLDELAELLAASGRKEQASAIRGLKAAAP